MRFKHKLIVGVLLAAAASPACKRKQPDANSSTATQTTASPAKAGAAPTQTASNDPGGVRLEPMPGGTVSVLKGYQPKVFQIPVGPTLGIFPGQGVGAIRFGATVETVERLMQSKCSEKTESVCRYAAHAIDFHFTDGVVSKIHVQGDERAFSDKPDDSYGVYNGRFVKGAALGMYSPFVIETLGEPKRIEKVEPAPERGTVERHHYDNMTLEYDKLENSNTVLAGVVLTRPPPANASEAK